MLLSATRSSPRSRLFAGCPGEERMNTIRIGVVLVSLALASAGCESPRPMPTTATPVLSVGSSFPAGPPSEAFPLWHPDITLSGVISEAAPNGLVPLQGVRVYCEPCGEATHTTTFTDANGFYRFEGVWNTIFAIHVSKD